MSCPYYIDLSCASNFRIDMSCPYNIDLSCASNIRTVLDRDLAIDVLCRITNHDNAMNVIRHDDEAIE